MNLFNKNTVNTPWTKYYTKEELNIEVEYETMYDAVNAASNKYPNYVALSYFNRKISFNKFIKKVETAAKSFVSLGIKKGDIVSICMPNTPEVVYAVYALNRIGAIAHMIHPLSAEEEIKNDVNYTKSTILLLIDMNYEKLENIIEKTNLQHVIFISAADSMPFYLHMGYNLTKKRKYKKYPRDKKFLSWKKFMNLSTKCPFVPSIELTRDDAAVILHSGGTSGRPKYVVISNEAFNISMMQEKVLLKRIKPGDSGLAVMPNFHGFGLSVCIHTVLSFGCTSILVPQFDASKFDVLINKTKPTVILGVPTLFDAFVNSNNVKKLDLSHIKYIISGGDQLSLKLEDKINDFLKNHNCSAYIVQGYGLSEGLAAVSLCADKMTKQGSVGIPMPGNIIKIIDPATRKTLPFGKSGEICITGKTLMKEYLDNESETNEVLQLHDDNRIWLHTGDMGHMDNDGFLYYDQRIKRMIVTSGYNVYPNHVESIIEKHPKVLQCTVVAMPHPYKVNVPKAFIVLKNGEKPSLKTKLEIKSYCKKNLAHYMCPYKYVYRKALPKTKLGKIDFKALEKDNGDDEV